MINLLTQITKKKHEFKIQDVYELGGNFLMLSKKH